MKGLEDLPLYTFVRFVITGLVATLLYLVMPVAVLDPGALQTITNVGNVIGIVVMALTIGFVLDGLKLYQLSPGYRRRKSVFMKRIASTLAVREDEAPTYFVKVAELERTSGMADVALVHSRWVMNVCSKLFLFAGILWGIVAMVG